MTDADAESTDSFERLTEDLRALRERHMDKSLAAFEKRTDVSTTTYSDTLNGKVRPSVRTISGLAMCCGEDPEPYLLRRRNLLASERAQQAESVRGTELPVAEPPRGQEQTADAAPPSAGPVTDDVTDAKTRTRRSLGLGWVIGIAASVAVVSSVVTSMVWSTASHRPATAQAAPATQQQDLVAATSSAVPYKNGADPMKTECREDKVLAASETRGTGHGKDEFLVQYYYSPKCMAVWGQITRYDNNSATEWLAVDVYAQGEPNDSTAQTKKSRGVQTMYSPMRIEPNKEKPNCVLAHASVGGKEVDLGPELCA